MPLPQGAEPPPEARNLPAPPLPASQRLQVWTLHWLSHRPSAAPQSATARTRDISVCPVHLYQGLSALPSGPGNTPAPTSSAWAADLGPLRALGLPGDRLPRTSLQGMRKTPCHPPQSLTLLPIPTCPAQVG